MEFLNFTANIISQNLGRNLKKWKRKSHYRVCLAGGVDPFNPFGSLIAYFNYMFVLKFLVLYSLIKTSIQQISYIYLILSFYIHNFFYCIKHHFLLHTWPILSFRHSQVLVFSPFNGGISFLDFFYVIFYYSSHFFPQFCFVCALKVYSENKPLKIHYTSI